MQYRWTTRTNHRIGCKTSLRFERRDSYWRCNSKTIEHFAVFREGFVCLFFCACCTGDMFFTSVLTDELWMTRLSDDACSYSLS